LRVSGIGQNIDGETSENDQLDQSSSAGEWR